MVEGIKNRSVAYDKTIKRGDKLGDIRVVLKHAIEADVPPKDPQDLEYDPRQELAYYLNDGDVVKGKLEKAIRVIREELKLGVVDCDSIRALGCMKALDGLIPSSNR